MSSGRTFPLSTPDPPKLSCTPSGVAIVVGAAEIIAPHFIALARDLWHVVSMDTVVWHLSRMRYGRIFVLVTTYGKHWFFEEWARVIRDLRRVPLKLDGYSVSHRNGHASVCIAQETHRRLKADRNSSAVCNATWGGRVSRWATCALLLPLLCNAACSQGRRSRRGP